MKRIGIDARLYNKTGVGVYIRNFLYYLQKSKWDDVEFFIYVMQKDANDIKFEDDRFHKIGVPYVWHSVSEQIGFARRLYQDHLDLVHFPYFSYPVMYRRKFIATVHDTILLQHKTGRASTYAPFIYELKHAAFRFAFSNQIQHASALVTPTNTVKNQLVEYYGNTIKDKTFALYEGVDHELKEAKSNKELEQKFTKPFFLYVGNFYPHKNIESLIRAFSKIKHPYHLILVGPDDYFSKRIYSLIKETEQIERIHIYKNASVNDLAFFYTKAEALIHPSLSEGFGLPLIEAAYFNLPVIASDIEVFHELLGDQYLSFDPTKVDDIGAKINYFVENKKNLHFKPNTDKYSFEKMSERLISLFKGN